MATSIGPSSLDDPMAEKIAATAAIPPLNPMVCSAVLIYTTNWSTLS